MRPVHVIGAGLAGSEAAFQLASCGVPVVLYEMRPIHCTPAHRTDRFAELVCSNSLKSDQPPSASWLLKQELRQLGSLCLRMAAETRVPGGQALTVDREAFAESITRTLLADPLIQVRREEVREIPTSEIALIATGPLTSEALASSISSLTGSERLFFYDSISPIVADETVDRTVAFLASRYDKSLDGSADYLNCPLDEAEYDRFYDALISGQSFESHIPEDAAYFESCLPIEEIARRGRHTLRFGPMKPAGLMDPRTGRRPYACVQLRQESLRADSWNLVGFQNHLKFPEQKRILRLIPGLQNAEFLRYGQIHRNTYVNAPALLTPTLQFRKAPRIFCVGQLSGVEGYVESIATGLIGGLSAASLVRGEAPLPFPPETALGSLCRYIAGSDARNFQPANIAFDLFPPLDSAQAARFRHDKSARHLEICRRSLAALQDHLSKSTEPAHV